MTTGETAVKRKREVDALVARIMFSMQDMVVEQKRAGVERVNVQPRAARRIVNFGEAPYSGENWR